MYKRILILGVILGVILVVILGVDLYRTDYAHAATRKPAVCRIWSEDGVWAYDTHDITIDDFEKHHVRSFKQGKTFKVKTVKNGFAKVKYKGKVLWISASLLEVKTAGWIKLEGKWKKVKPGFDFWEYYRYGGC